MKPVIEARIVSKRYGEVRALDGVDFAAYPGEVHALVGENGAGKSTLVKILFGSEEASSGGVIVDGREAVWHNSAEAIGHGIGMVSQHTGIIPELSCLENIALGSAGSQILDWGALRVRAEEIARSLGFSIDWDAPAGTLGPAGHQRLEIVQLLWRESRVLILDEPTAMLSPQDAEAIYAILRGLAERGATVIVVTHKIPEVMDYCDRVTALRGGRFIATSSVADTNPQQLTEWIVGKALTTFERKSAVTGEAALVADRVCISGVRGGMAVVDASFTVHKGEVVGIAGVDGNGQRELFAGLFGVSLIKSGGIAVGDRDVSSLPTAARISLGMRIVPEDRHSQAVVSEWSIWENAVLGLHRLSPVSQGLWLDEAECKRLAERVVARFATKSAGIESTMRSLSGGNQQKTVVARALEFGPKVVLAFQPTRGLDIEASRRLFAALRGACDSGAGVLVVSYDLDDLLDNCDRVLVMHEGRIAAPEEGKRLDRDTIGRMMVGVQ